MTQKPDVVDDPFQNRGAYFQQVVSQISAVTSQLRRSAELRGETPPMDAVMLLACTAAAITELRVIEDLLVALNAKTERPLVTLARPI
jgi:hypothetical protein